MKLKKFTITRIFGIMVAIATFYGCQQEDVLQEQSDIALNNDTKASFLSFDSKSDYEQVFSDHAIIKSKESMQGDFVSLKSTIENFDSEKNARKGQRLEDTLYADYGILPKILNRDKIVKIGDYLIKVDLHTETVLVLESKYRDQYKDLAASNMDNENIMTFSTDDEVLTLLEQGATGSVNSRLLGWCNDPSAEGDKDDDHSCYSKKKRYKAKVVYQRGGIYYSILAKIKNQKKKWGIWWSDGSGWLRIDYNLYAHVRCGEYFNESSYIKDYDRKAIYRPYEGTVRMEYYELNAYFTSSNGSAKGLSIKDI